MNNLPVSGLVVVALPTVFGLSLLRAWLASRHDARQTEGEELWQAVRLRNGITESSPWHSAEHIVNTPGLVRVCPDVHTAPEPPLHEWEYEPMPDPSERPASVSVKNSFGTRGSGGSELPELPVELPIKLTTPPHLDERECCRLLVMAGLGQVATIKQVWDISKGGGKRYQEARKRLRKYVADCVPPGDLYASLRKERKNHA